MNKQTFWLTVLAVALVISVSINIILWIAWPKNAPESPSADPGDMSITDDKEMTDITTAYGVVKFPTALSDISYQVTEEEGVYTLSFSYLHGDEEVELYAVHFGDEERGTLIGYVNTDGTEVPFTVTSADASVDETWPTGDQERFNMLMMSVNDVIASVQAWDSYVG